MYRNCKFDSAVVLVLMTSLLVVASTVVAADQQAPSGSTVSASTQSSASVATASPAVVEEDSSKKMICRQSAPIGTRITKKTCKTAADWEELRRMGSDAARTGTEQGRICGDNCGAPGG